MAHTYIDFALAFNVPPSVAYVLPALFERAARMAGMAPHTLLQAACTGNRKLGIYLAECAHKVAEEVNK
jgi:hypothetical protein